MDESTSEALLGYNPVRDRILTIRLKGTPRNVKVIQIYAPTPAAEEEEVEDLYNTLQTMIDQVRKHDIVLIMGYFNVKIVTERAEDEGYVVGKFSTGHEADDSLTAFCMENELMIANTLFKQHPRRLYTWTSPDEKTIKQITF